jgi:hypothetical protein
VVQPGFEWINLDLNASPGFEWICRRISLSFELILVPLPELRSKTVSNVFASASIKVLRSSKMFHSSIDGACCVKT